MKLKGIEIKPGMVIETETCFFVAFPTENCDCPIAFIPTVGKWTCGIEEAKILKIMGPLTKKSIASGKVFWDKEMQPKELSMEEIAEKFGIPVEQLRIKKG